MATSYRQVSGVISFIISFLLIFTAIAVNAQKASEADKIKVTGIKIPVYQEGRDIPIIILTSEEAKPIGVRFEMKGVKLVWLGDTMKDIRGTVETDVAVYDQSSKSVGGGETITYRSKEVDIDGVGFDIDHEKQTLHIRSKVKVVLKGDLSSAKQLRQTQTKSGKGGALSLAPTTKKGKEATKGNSNLKKLLGGMTLNQNKVKETVKDEK